MTEKCADCGKQIAWIGRCAPCEIAHERKVKPTAQQRSAWRESKQRIRVERRSRNLCTECGEPAPVAFDSRQYGGHEVLYDLLCSPCRKDKHTRQHRYWLKIREVALKMAK